MKLNKLYIKNFKHISEIEIDDFKRITVVIGENGQGKSSLMQAISFLYTNNLDEKIENFVRWGADKFEIVAEFSHESDNLVYEVEGSKTKSSKRKLTINGDEDSAFVNSEASKKFAEYIDPVLTEYSAVSQQGKTTELLFQKPAERLKTIKEILKIDNIFTACENIKEDVKKIKEDIDKIDVEQNILNNRSYSFIDEDNLKKQVEEDADVEKLLLKEEQTKAVYDKECEAVKQYERDLLSFNNYTVKVNNLKDQISVCEHKLLSYEGVVVPEFEFDVTEFENLKTPLQELKLQQNQYSNDLKNYAQSKENLDRVEKQIVELKVKADAIVLKRLAACLHTEESIKEIQKKINVVDVNITRDTEKLELVKKGKCPTCGKDFEEDPAILESSIATLKEERNALVSERNNTQSEIDNHKKIVDDQKELSITKTGLLDKIKFQEEERAKYMGLTEPTIFDPASIVTIEKEIAEKEISKKKLDEIKKNNAVVNSDIKSTKDKIDFYNSELKSLVVIEKPVETLITVDSFDNNYYESLKKRFAVKDQKEQEYKRAVEFNTKLMIEKKADQTTIVTNEKKKESLLKEMQIKAESRNFLEKGFSSYLVDKSITFLKEKMNSFFQRTYNKYEVTVEQDKNSVSFFYADGENISPCSMASGAEKSLLALSSRLALCSLQKSLDFMIVDEIDSELSASNSQKVFETLLAENQFNQFFIITHCDPTKEYFENLNDCEIIEIKEGKIV